MTIKELKEQALLANLEIPKHNLAIYTWGNVSAFDKDKEYVAIKPSGVEYNKLTLDSIVVLDLEGNIVEGNLKPSSDTPTHLMLYKTFPKIGGICHTHSPNATAWAQARSSIPLLGTTHADYMAFPIPCTRLLTKLEVEENYELNTAKVIIETLNNPSLAQNVLNIGKYPKINKLKVNENPMILVAGHGPFTWGKDANESVYNASVLEECAKMATMVKEIKGTLEELPNYIIDKHYKRKHGPNSYYGQN